ncbi:family 2 glycosyl transferase [Nocardiopsis sp. NRRL B-16309]|uniref:family 2 glycosyl transferase n=1 Tax=Nocardiopsis sp. NRRL B-16309 TaxID=1519494 RepID=UPI0006ADE294|nr:family 2 glycosyl transferase [Nocardiopsis sp. NRRL B-16309]KOX24212.1 family 2 glycosyl transferase [Nocardiopsis sp. NRRL B-16309]
MASPSPLPPGLGVEIDRAVRLADEGHVLVGGSPPRALRLTPSQLSAVIRWSSGSAPSGWTERVLARVLIEEGLAHPRPLPPVPFRSAADVDVAVVGQAGAHGLARTLDRLAELHPDVRPVVVGATGPRAWAARARGARIVPGPSGGPEARAEALRVCAAEFVALLESGSRPGRGWLDAALGHFADPAVAAVVPRVLTERPRAAGHWRQVVAAVAAARTGADRGADPAPVLPWGQGPGQPGAANEHTAADPLRPLPALVLRRSALDGTSTASGAQDGSRRAGATGGWALRPELRSGAELDLVWCLAGEGRTVRYEPRARVWARPVTDLGGYLRACFAAGARAAPLARRHGRRAAGPELSPEGAVGLALAASGRPGAGAAVAVLAGVAAVREEPDGAVPPWPETVRLVAGDVAHTARLGARAAREAWWPVAASVAASVAVACALRRGRGGRRIALVAGAALVLPHLASWRADRGAVLVGPLTWTALGMAGDAARSAGTWWGAARTGSAAPLIPRLRTRARVAGVPAESPDGPAAPHSRVKTVSLLLVRGV